MQAMKIVAADSGMNYFFWAGDLGSSADRLQLGHDGKGLGRALPRGLHQTFTVQLRSHCL